MGSRCGPRGTRQPVAWACLALVREKDGHERKVLREREIRVVPLPALARSEQDGSVTAAAESIPLPGKPKKL